jgi:hypothetical protein
MEKAWELIDRIAYEDDDYGERLSDKLGSDEICLGFAYGCGICMLIPNGLLGLCHGNQARNLWKASRVF